MDTVQEISERHAAVKDLERQLIGLHEIFLQMATIVEEQGEMLDNIEKQARTGSLSATDAQTREPSAPRTSDLRTVQQLRVICK